jgi:hypothetical protein
MMHLSFAPDLYWHQRVCMHLFGRLHSDTTNVGTLPRDLKGYNAQQYHQKMEQEHQRTVCKGARLSSVKKGKMQIEDCERHEVRSIVDRKYWIILMMRNRCLSPMKSKAAAAGGEGSQ